MLRKRHAKAAPEPAVPVPAAVPQAPVNVVVVMEPRRGRRPKPKGEETGHPVVKGLLGLAVAKRLARPRRRPLRKRVGKAVRKGRRKVKKALRKARRRLR